MYRALINEKLYNKRILLICVLLCGLLTGIFGVKFINVTKENETIQPEELEMLQISADSGFYSEDFSISVFPEAEGTIYYTFDGTEPDEETGYIYTEPIEIEATDEENVYTYAFLFVPDDGEASKCVERTYFVGKNIWDRYDTYVLSVSGNPDALFSYDRGIFVKGRLWDEFFEMYPDVTRPEIQGYIANFTERGRDFERVVRASLFDSDGKLMDEKTCGIRIYGSWSRIKNQKSFKLICRDEYDMDGNFDYTLFEDYTSRYDGRIPNRFKRLILSNSGDDNGFAFMRNQLAVLLLRNYSKLDMTYFVPATVYINGEYNGIYWLQAAFDNKYFKNKYFDFEPEYGEFVILEGTEDEKDADEEHLSFATEYMDKYNEFVNADLNDDNIFAALNEFMDVDNYLDYYAAEYLSGNNDWPTNNYKCYRFSSGYSEYIENTVFDGRWRFILNDVDSALNLQYDAYNYGVHDYILEKYAQNYLFSKLMKREATRNSFINKVCTLLFTAYDTENADKIISFLDSSRRNELTYMLEETDIMKDSIIENDSYASMERVDIEISHIKEYIAERPNTVIAEFKDYFGLTDTYDLNIHSESAYSFFEVNDLKIRDAKLSGTFFLEVPVFIRPVISENEEFECWEVNGEKIFEAELCIDEKLSAAEKIDVTLITKAKLEPVLSLNAIKAKGNDDFVEIINLSQEKISTEGYYLSDDEDVFKYRIPGAVLAPNESIKIYCKSYSKPDGLGKICCNFDLKDGESLTFTRISRKNGKEILETIAIPKLSLDDGIYERNYETGGFIEKKLEKTANNMR